jgi:hypothetical protein
MGNAIDAGTSVSLPEGHRENKVQVQLKGAF